MAIAVNTDAFEWLTRAWVYFDPNLPHHQETMDHIADAIEYAKDNLWNPSAGTEADGVSVEGLEWPKAVALLHKWEGFREHAYLDSAGVPTIGYGFTHYLDGRPVRMGDRLSRGDSDGLLEKLLREQYIPPLTRIPGWAEMGADRQSALISFGWNLGPHFYGSPGFNSISRDLQNRNWVNVPNSLLLYSRAGGQKLLGLVNRRKDEGLVWNGGEPLGPDAYLRR